MTGPAAEVAEVRVAVRRALADLAPDAPVLVALSGGPDSLALLAATAWLRPAGVTAVVVDHGWSAGSAAQAARAAEQARALGACAEVLAAPTGRDEAAARAARYAALDVAAQRHGALAVLLGHTRDDQAESVLLGLARGSGPRSLAGMAARRGLLRRPLLRVARATTVAACRELGLDAWADPANNDPAFARVRVRSRVLPLLAQELGHDVRPNLARTAELLREDTALLDELAGQAALEVTAANGSLDAAGLAALPAALRRRVLHAFAAGAPGAAGGAGASGAAGSGGAVTLVQVDAMEALVTAWHGQGAVTLAGGRTVARASGRISLVPAHPAVSDLPLAPGISKVLISEAQIQDKIRELAARIDADHAGQELVLVAVLKGAIMVMADLSRALTLSVNLEFMAVSSYGAATSSSGVVRILKDLDRDIRDRHVLVVEDIIDSGLTLSWLVRNLAARHPASLEVCALLRKPEAVRNSVEVRYVGFDLGPDFVVGYGLDHAERYRTLPYVGLLDPSAID